MGVGPVSGSSNMFPTDGLRPQGDGGLIPDELKEMFDDLMKLEAMLESKPPKFDISLINKIKTQLSQIQNEGYHNTKTTSLLAKGLKVCDQLISHEENPFEWGADTENLQKILEKLQLS